MDVCEDGERDGDAVGGVRRGEAIFEVVGANRWEPKKIELICTLGWKVAENVLMRVTGGAKGRGEQMRSLMTEVRYTPSARTIRRLWWG